MIVIAAAVILYQNILEDTWSEKLTEKSEVTQYLDFYPAGADSISAEKGVFIINNKTNRELRTGEFYILQRKILGKWSDMIEPLDVAAVGYDIPPGEYKFTADWEEYYGKLKPGTYRMIKDCNMVIDKKKHEQLEFVFACEFKL